MPRSRLTATGAPTCSAPTGSRARWPALSGAPEGMDMAHRAGQGPAARASASRPRRIASRNSRAARASAASAASRSIASAGTATFGTPDQTAAPNGTPPASRRGGCGTRRAIMTGSCAACSGSLRADRRAALEDRGDRSPRSAVPGLAGAARHTLARAACPIGARPTCRSSIATCTPRSAPRKRSIAATAAQDRGWRNRSTL